MENIMDRQNYADPLDPDLQHTGLKSNLADELSVEQNTSMNAV